MADVQPQIATRHHTHEEQVQACCRILAHTADAFVEELDDGDGKERLRRLADDLRRAGGDSHLGGGPAPVLRLVARQGG